MPLGVRDFLLIIRAKDQASRVITDVGRSFGKLQKQSTASMREAANNLRAHNNTVNAAFRKDIQQSQAALRQNATVSSALSRRNAQLRVDYAHATSAVERAAIAEEHRNNTLRKAMISEQSTQLRQTVAVRREVAQGQVREAQRGYDEEKAAFQRHNDAIQAQMDQVNKRRQQGQSLLGIGAGLAIAGGAGVAALASATKDAVKYNKEASKTLTQVDPALGASLETVKNIGREVAKAVPAPFEEMQKALYDIFSSMSVNIPQAEMLLRNFAKGAVAGATDVETASQAAISLLNAFKLPPTAANVKRVMDAQFETVRVGRIEYDELAKTIGRAIPSAVKAGQSIEDLGGLIAFLTRNGLSSAMAATSAARAYDLMSNPKFNKNMEELGIKVADSEGKFRPFLDIMVDLRKRMEGVQTPQAAQAMQAFMKSIVDPDALKFLEDLGIQVKQTVGGKDFKSQIQKNAAAAASLTTKNAQLRIKAAQSTSKAEKKTIADAIKANSVQKAILSEQNVALRSAGSKSTETMRPIVSIMTDLNKKLQEVSPEERAEIMAALTKGAGGTIQAMRAVNLAITDSDDLFGTLTRDVRENAGAIDAAYKIMAATPENKIEALRNKYKVLKTTIGDDLLPILASLLEKGAAVLDWLGKLDPDTRRMAVYVALGAASFLLLAGGVTAAAGAFLILSAALAPFGLTLAGLLLAFGAWLIVIGLVSASVYILSQNWEDFKLGIKVILAEIVDAFLGWGDRIISIMASIFGWLPGIGGKLRAARDEFREFRIGVNQEILGIMPVEITPVIKSVSVSPAVYEFLKNGPTILGAGGVANVTVDKAIPINTAAKATLPSPIVKHTGRMQPRAVGGPVYAFRNYLVGENGPEVLRMGAQAGKVFTQRQFMASQIDDRRRLSDRFSDDRDRPTRYDADLGALVGRQQVAPSVGNTTHNWTFKTEADSNEISHDVVFALRYEV